MGRSHHDQVRPVLREARLANLRLLRRPGGLSAQIVRSSPGTDKRSATLLTRSCPQECRDAGTCERRGQDSDPFGCGTCGARRTKTRPG